MFAVLNIHILQNAGCQLAFTMQAFFMPGHIVYHIWYPCTPVWSVNAPTAFCRCVEQRERHGYFHLKNLLLCSTMQKFLPLLQTASERPPTKRVLHSSPLPAIPTPTLPLTASTFRAAPSAICGNLTLSGTPSPGASISPAAKRLPEQPATKLLSSSWYVRTASIAAMWQNVTSTNVNGICFRSSTVIRMQWYYRLTSLKIRQHINNHYRTTSPKTGCAECLHSKLNINKPNNMHTTEIFELAMRACAYQIDHIWYDKNSRNIRKVYGQVPVSRKSTINGVRKTFVKWKRFRWNDAGQCFSRYSQTRRREYDLPLNSIIEQLKRERS